MMTVLVEKMIKMNILEPAIVQAWVFSDEMKVEFKRFTFDFLNLNDYILELGFGMFLVLLLFIWKDVKIKLMKLYEVFF